MFAVQCTFCQHENVPGARFCAECGSPLHLRVCPNSKCGKVSDVNAKQCEHCGTFFPEIPLADGSAPAREAPAAAKTQPAAEKKQGVSALPLIIVAVVAGGLPLLWFNRSHLPAPKNWQPDPVGSAAAPAQPAPFPVPPPVSQPAAALPPLQVAPPVEPDLDKAATDKAAAEKAAQEAEALAKAERQKAAKAKTAREAKALKAKEAREAAAAAEAQRPCTEAIAAVGLCDPKQIKK